jgi:hypothetical protein
MIPLRPVKLFFYFWKPFFSRSKIINYLFFSSDEGSQMGFIEMLTEAKSWTLLFLEVLRNRGYTYYKMSQ